MKTVFKVGMEVWDKTISPKRGKVIEVFTDYKYDFPIIVEFENNVKVKYTTDGCFVKNKGTVPTLSTSDYSIETKGFEQKAPVPTFETAVNWIASDNRYNPAYAEINKKEKVFLSETYFYAFEALRKLIILRDYYNEGWQPDWNTSGFKQCIELEGEVVCGRDHAYSSRVLAFKSGEIRDKFLKDQKELLEIAKPLL